MKKVLLGILVAAVVVIALGTAGYAYAQATNPPTPVPGTGYGRGMGMRGQFADADLNGPMHDEMVAALSAKLGISVDDLNARLAKGETMAQIALSKGITAEQWPAVMAEIRGQALDAAVKNGSLTQAQADAMKQRGAGMMGAGMGAGMQGGRGRMQGQGMRGGMMGRGQMDSADCPMVTTPQ
jgi:hypothetical protein